MEFINGADVEQAMTGLLNLLGEMMEQLANFFGTSSQHVQEYFMKYLLRFGRYSLFNTCIDRIAIVAILYGIFVAITCLVFTMDLSFNNFKQLIKSLLAKSLAFIVIAVILIIIEVSKYFIMPELYSIHAVLEALGYF